MPFTKPWWTWLIATGVSLSFVMSTKYVGLFTFITIGSAVAVDLWNLLDYRRGLPMVLSIKINVNDSPCSSATSPHERFH